MKDHPTIENLINTGTPDGRLELTPVCPVCGEEADDIYKNVYGEIIGCDKCIKRVSAWDALIEEEV